MQSQFEASYHRMEQSLHRLTESIAAYNPSTTAANDLAAADDAVNENLEQLVEHQQNHARIQTLKRASESLDETLKTQFRLIVELRKELAAIPSSEKIVPPMTSAAGLNPTTAEVGIEELLAYAKFISKTTVPPTFRKPDTTLPAAKSTAPTDQTEPHIPNGASGIATPPHPAPAPAAAAAADTKALQAISAQDRAWLDSATNLPFTPWPSHDVIQAGALAGIQRMVERGDDPTLRLSAEEQVEADKRRAEEEAREQEAREEKERRRASLFDAPARRRTGVVEDVFDPDA